MPTILNADNGVVSGISGLTTTADNSGILNIQTNGTTAITVDASQGVTFANPIAASGASLTNLNATSITTGTLAAARLPASGVSATSITTGMLDQAYGGTGTTVGYNGFKNRIINGAMVIDQRNAGASVTPADSAYTLDRWQSRLSQASKYSVQQSSTAPAGFTKSLLVTSLSAYTVGASEFFQVRQIIEGLNTADFSFGTASAQPVSLSFWVRSSLTGTFGGVLSNADGDRTYVFSYTINAANTWEQKSITIAGDTTGSWLTTNGGGFVVAWSLGAGSSVSTTAGVWNASLFRGVTGGTSVVGTNGATFYITGVQLEKGSTATSFDYRPYGTELALCQRYYEILNFSSGGAAATNMATTVRYAVVKRAAPTITRIGNWASSAETGTTVSDNGAAQLYVFNSTTNATAVGGQYTSSAEL